MDNLKRNLRQIIHFLVHRQIQISLGKQFLDLFHLRLQYNLSSAVLNLREPTNRSQKVLIPQLQVLHQVLPDLLTTLLLALALSYDIVIVAFFLSL